MTHVYNYDPQSAEIKVQSPQSTTTSRRLTLTFGLTQNCNFNFFVKRDHHTILFDGLWAPLCQGLAHIVKQMILSCLNLLRHKDVTYLTAFRDLEILGLVICINVSYDMEFLAWWVLKSKIFAQNSTVFNEIAVFKSIILGDWIRKTAWCLICNG